VRHRTELHLPRSVARQVLLAINTAGETAGWWVKEFNLQPARQPEEIEIVRAASQLMKRYGSGAMEAGSRAKEDKLLGHHGPFCLYAPPGCEKRNEGAISFLWCHPQRATVWPSQRLRCPHGAALPS
jgi:hypothetical protein